MEDRKFAEHYPREGNLILFPRDVTLRREFFPQEVFDHPAKANIFLIRELIEYLTEPGDTVLDPFAGTGTLMMALLLGRNVALIEIEPHYADLIRSIWKLWEERGLIAALEQPTQFHLFQGDCRQQLQEVKFLCDAAIFSPPYATALSHSTAIKEQKAVLDKYALKGTSTQNLARLNPFFFTQAVALVFKRIHKRLVPNAPMAIITKDIMKGPRREFLSEGIIRQAQRNGFKLSQWEKWKPPGSMQQSIMKAKGANVVLDEDILIFHKDK